MIRAKTLEFLKNLAQYDYNNQYYDLHNDFWCSQILFEGSVIFLVFESMSNGKVLTVKFTKTEISNFKFFNSAKEKKLTIDTMYRGRAVVDGNLVEVSNDDKAYFYIEFYEGQTIEFWAAEMEVIQSEVGESI